MLQLRNIFYWKKSRGEKRKDFSKVRVQRWSRADCALVATKNYCITIFAMTRVSIKKIPRRLQSRHFVVTSHSDSEIYATKFSRVPSSNLMSTSFSACCGSSSSHDILEQSTLQIRGALRLLTRKQSRNSISDPINYYDHYCQRVHLHAVLTFERLYI